MSARITNVTQDDLTRLAGQIRLAGELLDLDGENAWTTTKNWAATGISAQNLDNDRTSNRSDDDGYPITIHDPTGNAASDTTTDPAAHDRLHRILVHVANDTGDLIDLLRTATPSTPKPGRAEQQRAELVTDGWCTSCFRDGGYLEPITTRRGDGEPYYVDVCKWCGEYRSCNDGELPPVTILNDRHAGRRITQAMIDKARAAQRAAKANAKKSRKRRVS